MPSTIRHSNVWLCAGAANLLAAITLSAGCATSSVIPAPAGVELVPFVAPLSPKPISVVRYGRYRLVELVPDTAQQDLLLQVVDISIPGTMSATVGDALDYLLLRSGYQLCEALRTGIASACSLAVHGAHPRVSPRHHHGHNARHNLSSGA
jgi:conjugative transfer region protein (TIGR03748 family)